MEKLAFFCICMLFLIKTGYLAESYQSHFRYLNAHKFRLLLTEITILPKIGIACNKEESINRGAENTVPEVNNNQDCSSNLPIECFAKCNCPRMLDCVCGTDGKNYQNSCLLDCAKESCPDLTKGLQRGVYRSGPC